MAGVQWGSIGSDALKSLTGNIETAVIVIHDFRTEVDEIIDNAGGLPSGYDTLAAFETSKLVEAANERSAKTAEALSGGQRYYVDDAHDKYFYVPFNPSQLTLNASHIAYAKTDSNDKASAASAPADAKLHLTTTLYFDEMQQYDAFMWDKFVALSNPLGSASNAANSVRALTGTRVYSVQPQVEALVSALRDPFTRTVSFRWADFCFTGQINTVQARYTMFSPSGRPIRAQVLLRIHHDINDGVLAGWYKDFETAFSGDDSSLVRWEQGWGNLTNLNL